MQQTPVTWCVGLNGIILDAPVLRDMLSTEPVEGVLADESPEARKRMKVGRTRPKVFQLANIKF